MSNLDFDYFRIFIRRRERVPVGMVISYSKNSWTKWIKPHSKFPLESTISKSGTFCYILSLLQAWPGRLKFLVHTSVSVKQLAQARKASCWLLTGKVCTTLEDEMAMWNFLVLINYDNTYTWRTIPPVSFCSLKYRSGKNVQFDVGIIIRRYILNHDAITHQDGYRSPGGNPGKFNDKVR